MELWLFYFDDEKNAIGIESLKARYDVTKLDLISPLLSFWYIDIELNIQAMSLTFNPCLLHCTWLECIRSYIEDTSNEFLASR